MKEKEIIYLTPLFMDKQVSQLFELYKIALDAHIGTKTICPTFHPKSADFY